MVRNAGKLYFPIKACIESLLPIVDEWIVAVGEGDIDDDTLAQIQSINSPKIKIYNRTWDEQLFKDGAIFREETTFALSKCSGDWCIYLQADEVIHEADLPRIKGACLQYQNDTEIEGMLLQYNHFYADYEHIGRGHTWYAYEIRIVRNGKGVASYKDAISFRINDRKMKVVELDIPVYHYGWVRPPALMSRKRNVQHDMHHGKEGAQEHYHTSAFEYGPLGRLEAFNGTHPIVMKEWIKRFDWAEELDYGTSYAHLHRPLHKHERLKYRIISAIEKHLNGGKQVFSFKNWEVVKRS